MRLWRSFALIFLAAAAFAQSDRGTITGTVADQAGALVPNVAVVATNLASGVQSKTETTETGNYTLASMPAGAYSISVEHQGFRKFEQSPIRVQVALTIRVDVVLQVGSTSESVTVTADAPLMKTESAEQSMVLSGNRINALPLNFSLGAGAIRNPLMFLTLAPGTSFVGWNDIRVNGAPANTFRIIFEGQDTTSALNARVSDESQPSIDAVEEFTLQSSNFSAEFGQVGGGLVNFTARSGANAYHGTVYDYLINEAFNSGVPFSNDGKGKHIKSRLRQNDMGASLGGPVWIPRLYQGKDRTFFFFNYEMYRNIERRYDGLASLPTSAYRKGDFSYLLSGRGLGTDPLGNPILDGAIYDPRSSQTVGSQIVRAPFPNNQIPSSLFDPVAVKIQNLLPPIDAAYANAPINNYERRYPNRKIQAIPSIKIDHNLSSRAKISFYYSKQRTDKDNGHDGLPDPISARRDQFIFSRTVRINYDHTLRPTLLNHFGIGYQRYHNPDATPLTNFNSVTELGLRGAVGNGFPRITGLGGGIPNWGPTNYQLYLQDKPTLVETITWIRGNHTFKLGGEWRIDTFTNSTRGGTYGNYNFSGNETTLPSSLGQNLQGGSIGFGYASFLLGRVNNASISNPADPQFRRQAWGLFAQDNWKLTRKLTLDIGLRYDVQEPTQELHHRLSGFDSNLQNPTAGNLPGAMKFAGYGPGRCNCNFGETYPYAIAPRLGLAYQLNPKTVLRAAWGLSYGQLSGFNYVGAGLSLGHGFNSIPFTTASFGDPALLLRDGLNYDLNSLYAVNFNPGIRPLPGQITGTQPLFDRNAGRPPRMNNWSIGLQREITKDLLVEAHYVGNRGVWFRANALIDYNALTPQAIAARGLDINNTADRTLLTSRLDSPLAQSRGFGVPYAGFPRSATVAQSLRPFPQFTGVGGLWTPLGNTWYDSLQVKVTKRYSAGLDYTVVYTWSKNLATVRDQDGSTVPVNDVFNRRVQKTLAPLDQPHILGFGFRYELPTFGLAKRNRFTRGTLDGWALSGLFRYASGIPIQVPTAQNRLGDLLFRGTFANRVPGEPLFLKDLNCHCIDPNKEFALNARAWSDPLPGQWGTAAAYYSDYRFQRRHSETLSLGKTSRLKEEVSLEIRFEFFNIFNRLPLPDPRSGNALETRRVSAAGVPEAGFGYINSGVVQRDALRRGQVVARLRF